ncbi:MAG TPA: YihY/virulence factor BrkB family protein [Thermoanaerobaculia bacterium]|nr:YihY/virulence factor BrkB family protein [Thermoanaerobaculia bacterium]
MRFSRDGCAFLAQALAFNALFAVFPLVVLILSAASYVFAHAQQRMLIFFNTINPALHDFVAQNLATYIFGRGISSIVALAFLVWSGKNLFMGLAYALDRALDVPKGRPLVHNIALSIVMLPVMGVVLVIAMALPVVLSIFMALTDAADRRYVTHVGAYVVSIALVFAVSMVLYRFLPNRKLSWGFALPGATFTALVWPFVQVAFAQYTLHVNFSHIYGALSVPLVLLLWFYLVGSVFLFGAEFCAAWAGQQGKAHVAALIDSIEPTLVETTAKR